MQRLKRKKPASQEKQKWLAQHSCSINYSGSAPAMEPEGVRRIFQTSESERNLQYTGYIGGDSKSFTSVVNAQPYGDKTVKKYECVGHLQKRLGAALRKIKKKHGNKKLSEGKTIGGYGGLTANRIDKLQTYHGLAIRRRKMILKE